MSKGPDKRTLEIRAAEDERWEDLPRLILTTTAGVILGVNGATVRHWIDEGKLSSVRIGLYHKLLRDEVLTKAGIDPVGRRTRTAAPDERKAV